MSLYEILLYSIITFAIFNLFLIIYPVNFIRTKMAKTVHTVQYIVLSCNLVVILFFFLFKSDLLKMQILISNYDNRLSLLMIFLYTSGFFAILLLLPCSWRLIKINESDFIKLNETQDIIVNIIYNSAKVDNLQEIYTENKDLFDDYSISKIIELFIKRYNAMCNCPRDTGDLLLKRCFEVIQINDNFEPNPFKYFNIFLSFGTSTILVFIIGILTSDFS